jgi:large subunit ribosomal protein L18
MDAKAKSDARERRHARVRRKVRGEAGRPRLAVFRSNRHIYAQLIDDRAARTLVAARRTRASRSRCSIVAASGSTGASQRSPKVRVREVSTSDGSTLRLEERR